MKQKNQAEYRHLDLPFHRYCNGIASAEGMYISDDQKDFAVKAANSHHALIERLERVSEYMERLWNELERLQYCCGEEDFQLIEALLNEKDGILKETEK